MTELPLDAKLQKFIAGKLAQKSAIESELWGALSYWLEANDHDGVWKLDWPARRIVRVDVEEEKAA